MKYKIGTKLTNGMGSCLKVVDPKDLVFVIDEKGAALVFCEKELEHNKFKPAEKKLTMITKDNFLEYWGKDVYVWDHRNTADSRKKGKLVGYDCSQSYPIITKTENWRFASLEAPGE